MFLVCVGGMGGGGGGDAGTIIAIWARNMVKRRINGYSQTVITNPNGDRNPFCSVKCTCACICILELKHGRRILHSRTKYNVELQGSTNLEHSAKRFKKNIRYC